MSGAITATASSLEALTQQYYDITSNLANANTAGYKRRMNVFSNELERQLAPTESTGWDGGGTVESELAVDFSQGALEQTQRPLDMGLSGPGFFVIETPEGPLYTRSGCFYVNPRGQLTDASGRVVAGRGGPLIVPNTAGEAQINVAHDGTVSVGGQAIGQLNLVEFETLQRLEPAGAGCFRAPEDLAPQGAAKTTVQQFYRESSNVNVVQELVNLITVTRMYEANINAIRAQDEQASSLLQVAMA
jgi:flagellar basal body rod protein FlgG